MAYTVPAQYEPPASRQNAHFSSEYLPEHEVPYEYAFDDEGDEYGIEACDEAFEELLLAPMRKISNLEAGYFDYPIQYTSGKAHAHQGAPTAPAVAQTQVTRAAPIPTGKVSVASPARAPAASCASLTTVPSVATSCAIRAPRVPVCAPVGPVASSAVSATTGAAPSQSCKATSPTTNVKASTGMPASPPAAPAMSYTVPSLARQEMAQAPAGSALVPDVSVGAAVSVAPAAFDPVVFHSTLHTTSCNILFSSCRLLHAASSGEVIMPASILYSTRVAQSNSAYNVLHVASTCSVLHAFSGNVLATSRLPHAASSCDSVMPASILFSTRVAYSNFACNVIHFASTCTVVHASSVNVFATSRLLHTTPSSGYTLPAPAPSYTPPASMYLPPPGSYTPPPRVVYSGAPPPSYTPPVCPDLALAAGCSTATTPALSQAVPAGSYTAPPLSPGRHVTRVTRVLHTPPLGMSYPAAPAPAVSYTGAAPSVSRTPPAPPGSYTPPVLASAVCPASRAPSPVLGSCAVTGRAVTTGAPAASYTPPPKAATGHPFTSNPIAVSPARYTSQSPATTMYGAPPGSPAPTSARQCATQGTYTARSPTVAYRARM
eukprot:CAMPEP_0194551638 /NCGR_PEP_ID=MMETSP0253-20130528/96320_1 /TAXON_ID=2966 /ORGANISM="Noctiluca scintillans" /LENGTH=602 /DNA_ID=CAMNT_0039399099 /DNA_START=147 /DNA_END=1954 /DNA_ORIENTATION=+